MDIRQLTYFVAIAEERQITAAARRLHISQPPLSYELASLERELGVTLVDRGPRGVTLTEAGKLLYQRATEILSLANSARQEVEGFGKGERGVLSVGMISSSGGQVPGRGLAKLADSYPDVRIELHEANTYQLLELLERGVVEVAVVRTPFPTEGLACRYLDPEPMVALTSEAYPCGKRAGVASLEDLAGVPLVLYRRFEQIVRDAFAERGLDLVIGCVNDDARTTCVWSQAGFGVGLVPSTILPVMNAEGLAPKRLEELELTTRIAVVWREGRRLSPLAQRFIDLFGGSELPA